MNPIPLDGDEQCSPDVRQESSVSPLREIRTSQIIRFGSFEVDLRSGELRRNGAGVRLQRQPFQVLVKLLERPGEVVTREELRITLWPADTFVDFDHGLNAAVKRLRDALGDSAENPQFVETLARRGYRFRPVVTGNGGSVQGGLNQENLSHYAYALVRIVFGVMYVMIGLSKLGLFGARLAPLSDVGTAVLIVQVVTGSLIAIGYATRPSAFIASCQVAAFYLVYLLTRQSNGVLSAQNQAIPTVCLCFVFLYIALHGSGIWSVNDALSITNSALPAGLRTKGDQFQSKNR